MNRNRSSFGLITFCASATLLAALALAVVFATATVAFAVVRGAESVSIEDKVSPAEGADLAQETVFAGLVTDDHCGARHSADSAKNPSECTQMCIRQGSKYSLVNGDNSYLLNGATNDLGKLAGQRVNVVGSLTGSTIKVSSVTAAR